MEIIIGLAKEAGVIIGKDIFVTDERFYDRVLSEGSLGLGESYMEGWWIEGDMSLDELAYRVQKCNIKQRLMEQSWRVKLQLLTSWLYRKLYPVNVKDGKLVGLQHYDLGNDFFEQMLGPSMIYSCGYFKGTDDLYQAQINKVNLIKEKLKLKRGDRVLDIGCGWGSIAGLLAEQGIVVEGLTISKEQYKYACEKYPDVKFILADYRDMHTEERYDAIFSVGMFEHVNHENYVTYMNFVDRMLKPEGMFLLHTIGRNDSSIVCEPWISKYIFPNSALPSLSQITQAAENLFVVEDVENFGPDYDKTLMCWYEKCVYNDKPEEFIRMWRYYLLMCAGNFRSRKCQLYQVVLSKHREVKYERI